MSSKTVTGSILTIALTLAACEQNPVQPSGPELSASAITARFGNVFPTPDPSGMLATYSTTGSFDRASPFFQSLGTNGRSCGTCHLLENGMGLAAASAAQRFAERGSADPLFADVDGANCQDGGRGARAHSLLINNGLIRVALTIPAQLTVNVVHDPYHCAIVNVPDQGPTIALYRRPLPSTNLRFLSAVMFDGRETVSPLNNAGTFLTNLRADLSHQAMDATLGHAQAALAPTSDQVSAIVDFEMSLFTAQQRDDAAGMLQAQGAGGGPLPLSGVSYFPGINDPLGGNPTGAPFNPASFSLYQSWLSLPRFDHNEIARARTAVARGEEIFDTHPLVITAVRGLNDALGQPAINGTCTTCHDAPNVGDHSLPVPLDIGTSHAPRYEQDPNIRAALAQLSVPDLPVYQVSCDGGPVFTSDPGRAVLTGNCSDVNRIKGPILRGLAARAPYFHNGAGATLDEVVAFYNLRFQMGLTRQEQSDLVAFLKTL